LTVSTAALVVDREERVVGGTVGREERVLCGAVDCEERVVYGAVFLDVPLPLVMVVGQEE